jgi:hypothetical protein
MAKIRRVVAASVVVVIGKLYCGCAGDRLVW